MEQISENKLFRSCEVLFGTDLIVSRQFLDYLQVGGIKSAYRKRALETHPDRVAPLDRRVHRQGAEQFHAVREAYETLLSFLKTKEKRGANMEPCDNAARGASATAAGAATKPKPPVSPRRRSTSSHSGNCTGQQASRQQRTIRPITLPDDGEKGTVFANTESYYQGPLPRRHLLFGHFLYYSGLANWRTITRILIWQRTERPRLGELGKRFGMCREQDIAAILRAKKPYRPFGETARMLGILSEQQVRVLIFHQQRMQKKFGVILLEKNLISEPELQELLYRFERHNRTLHTQ